MLDGINNSRRVWHLTIKASSRNETISSHDREALLWHCLDSLLPMGAPADGAGSSSQATPAKATALTTLSINFVAERRNHINVSIIGPFNTHYAELANKLEVLRIAWNNRDEAADLEASAQTASLAHLREMTWLHCGLTSVHGLNGRCPLLKKIVLFSCRQLTSLDGLENHALLQEVDASGTGITNIRSLSQWSTLCLRVLKVSWCPQLTSLDGIQIHAQLEEVSASGTAITSLRELKYSRALKRLAICSCEQLTTLEGLHPLDHALLEEIDAAYSGLTSVPALRDFKVLKRVTLEGCSHLVNDRGPRNSVVRSRTFGHAFSCISQ